MTRRERLACPAPALPDLELAGPTNGIDYEPRGVEVNRTMSGLLALALACDVTRVFTYQLAKPGSSIGMRSVGFAKYHDITHNEPGDQPMCSGAVKLFMRELVVLIEALRAMPEGAGTLLDSCAVMAAPDCTNPKVHGHKDFPLLVIGTAGGRLRPGTHYRSDKGENACRVPLTLARACGAQLPGFGLESGHCTEDLGALLV